MTAAISSSTKALGFWSAVPGDGLERRARFFLTANGLLLPFLALQINFHWLIWIAALWAVTFPASTWTIALVFRGARTLPAPTVAVGTT